MHSRILRLKPPAEPRPDPAFARIRDQFDIPREFPEAVLRAADEAAGRPLPEGRLDMRKIEMARFAPNGVPKLRLWKKGSRRTRRQLHWRRRAVGWVERLRNPFYKDTTSLTMGNVFASAKSSAAGKIQAATTTIEA